MSSSTNIPSEVLLIELVNDVLLPGAIKKISVPHNSNKSDIDNWMSLSNGAGLINSVVGVIPRSEKNSSESIQNKICTAASIVQYLSSDWTKPINQISVIGLVRLRILKVNSSLEGLPVAVVERIPDSQVPDDEEYAQLMKELKDDTLHILEELQLISPMINKPKKLISKGTDSDLIDSCASVIAVAYKDKLDVLNTINLKDRVKIMTPILKKYLAELKREDFRSGGGVRKRNIPYVKILKTFMPHPDGGPHQECDDLVELQEKLKKAKLPEYAQKVAFKELQRLKRMDSSYPEHTVLRNYVELMSELPWSVSSEETIDLQKAENDLNADHYGMEKLKERVLEYLAVRQLKNNLRGPILCFVGPPGVGKTSIGRSIAQTLGRKFTRISLGGVCNQADIRGHRRTYVGAMPGRIIQAIKYVGVNNPVILLDEIDKMSNSCQGDPGAALLEVLDPEQNCNFVDHYLNVPFDLSQVSFLATANRILDVSPALVDRMEVIYVSGYTQEEKFHIAQRHLLPKQLSQHGLDNTSLELQDESLKLIISGYTRESGVRSLQRKLAAVCRAVALKVATERNGIALNLPVTIDLPLLNDILGAPTYDGDEIWCRIGVPGVAVGLSVAEGGGSVLLVEVNKMESGTGQLVLTGRLGPVLKESAKLAFNWLRTVAFQYGLFGDTGDNVVMSNIDVHVHFPAGAIGKDGPSAGIAIAAALVSLFAEIPIAADVAFTGEITLRGLVLPVGGIKEKILAAHRAGLARVIMPKKCEKFLSEIPQHVLSEITIVLVNHMHEVIDIAFDGLLSPNGSNLDCKL